jgi:chloramphenicol O-acetyltransferase type A
MKSKVDFDSWGRREYFEYFGRGCVDPFFGVTVNVDCSVAFEVCRRLGFSFFVYYMFVSLGAVNLVENFRFRLLEGEVWLFDRVHASTTVGRADGSFGFALFEYTDDFDVFQKNATERIAEVQKSTGLGASCEDAKRLDVVHCTTLPWFSFTSFRHEKSLTGQESIPKMAFGKFFEHENKKWLPSPYT